MRSRAGVMPAWEREWPARVRRRPRLGDGGYLLLSELADSLVAARDRSVRAPADILDVGCGDKPYYPFFAGIAATYVGCDVVPGPRVDRVCPIEELAAEDRSVDLVLCTQVLEHARDPAAALRECARVLRPGGHLFASTHGTYPFHPHPNDYWRWTQQGLEALVASEPTLELVELVPHRGTVACLALFVATYLEIAATGLRIAPLARPAVALINLAGLAGDRMVGRLRYPHTYTLIPNFLVVARKRQADAAAA